MPINIENLRAGGSWNETTPGHCSLESILAINSDKRGTSPPFEEAPTLSIPSWNPGYIRQSCKRAPSIFSSPSCFYLCPLPTCFKKAGYFSIIAKLVLSPYSLPTASLHHNFLIYKMRVIHTSQNLEDN